MKTIEIPKEEWSEFFNNFSSRHEGWLVTLEVLSTEIGAQVEGEDLAFEGISYDRHEGECDDISIMAGGQPADHVTRSITSPVRVSLEQTDEGADAVLAIESPDKTTLLLRFRSPMLPELVDGVVVQQNRPLV